VGVEFAQMFATFGSRVTIIENGPHLLPREDEDVAEAVTELFIRDGITVRTHEEVEWVDRDPETCVHVKLVDGDELVADEILVALGREPVTAELDLHAAKVRVTDEGFIEVDEYLRTSAKRTWAAGDGASTPQFTHASLDDYRIIKSGLSGTPRRSTLDRLIPYTVFITPELGRVGLTEQLARGAGHDVVVATLPVAQVPRARTMRETDGFWKAVIDAGTGEILGAALLGPEAGETISTIQRAMESDLPYMELRDAIISHPTMTEGLNLLFANVNMSE
jgi:pyruvate/2-oxoglutarate dehydrogenase complex dihydrolipoamide dehydrogenase (E3) component